MGPMGQGVSGQGKTLATRRDRFLSCRSPKRPCPDPGFIVTISKEPAALVIAALESIRKVYPDSPVTLVTDGKRDNVSVEFAAFGVTVVEGEHLKNRRQGWEWWRRFLTVSLAPSMTGKTVFKFDPDARMHRKFALDYPDAVFGTYIRGSTPHVQGGVQGFSPEARRRLLGRLSTIDGDLTEWICPRPNPPDYFSSDHSVHHLCKITESGAALA